MLLRTSATVCLTVILLSGLWIFARSYFGAVDVAISWLNGERIVAVPRTIDFGDCVVDYPYERVVRLVNLTDHPAIVDDTKQSCRCIAFAPQAAPIPAGASGEVMVRAIFAEPGTAVQEYVDLIVLADRVYKVRVDVLAPTVTASQPTLAAPAN